MIETRTGFGTLVDPLTIDRDAVPAHRLDALDAWIEAEHNFKNAEAACDGFRLELETAMQSRLDYVQAYGTKFTVSFRQIWEETRHRGGAGK